MKCSSCGAEVPAGVKFCGACGSAVQSTGFCINCGAQLPPGAAFCGGCGAAQGAGRPAAVATPVGSPPPGQTPPQGWYPPQPPPKRGGMLAMLAGIPILGLLFMQARVWRDWGATVGTSYHTDYGYSGPSTWSTWSDGSSSAPEQSSRPESSGGFDSHSDFGGGDSSSD